MRFAQARIAPAVETAALLSQVELADAQRLEEIALELAGFAIRTLNEASRVEPKTNLSTQRRMVELIRHLERCFTEAWSVAQPDP